MTSPELAILVPVLNRPQNVEPLLESISHSTPGDWRVIFLVDPSDDAELEAIYDAIVVFGTDRVWFRECGGSYAAKINFGARHTDAPLVFLAADDLRFRRGWLDAARQHLSKDTQVVGVNDLCSDRVQRGEHATHFLMTREYALQPTVDGGRGPLHEGYRHWFCDDELVATARRRGVLAFARDSIVEHFHPMNGKAPDDETYRKGREHQRQDRALFRQRLREHFR
jgi:glycosyltransferase involved in cell wall biosynthesis